MQNPSCCRISGSTESDGQSEDYHTEMNGTVFKDWLHVHLLPNVPNNAVIVFDRATYHLELCPSAKCASQTMNKAALTDWLLEHEAKDDNGVLFTLEQLLPMRKNALFTLCDARKPRKKYLVHEWLREWNASHGTDIRLNILPVAHPTLNPIEMIWNFIKSYVKSNNHDFNMTTIHDLARQRVDAMDASWWLKACNHSHKFALDYLAADDVEPEESADADDAPGSEDDYSDPSSEESASDDESEDNDDRYSENVAVVELPPERSWCTTS